MVFPSNRALVIRTRGMAEATLRRHLAALVESGLIIRRDSPNGKRYCRRGPAGSISQAFGFDLIPLVARADEFARLAAAVRADASARRLARERVTLLRRDCVKSIAAVEDAGIGQGAAEPLKRRYDATMGALPRVPTRRTSMWRATRSPGWRRMWASCWSLSANPKNRAAEAP